MSLSFPRHVHRLCGRFLEVRNEAQYDLAIADGWSDQPVPYRLVKGEESINCYSAESVTAALLDGWVPPVPDAPVAPVLEPKKGKR